MKQTRKLDGGAPGEDYNHHDKVDRAWGGSGGRERSRERRRYGNPKIERELEQLGWVPMYG